MMTIDGDKFSNATMHATEDRAGLARTTLFAWTLDNLPATMTAGNGGDLLEDSADMVSAPARKGRARQQRGSEIETGTQLDF